MFGFSPLSQDGRDQAVGAHADVNSPREEHGDDRGEGLRWRQEDFRHIAVDSQELPHLLHVTTSNVSDKAGARQMIAAQAGEFQAVRKVLGDGIYDGQPFASFVGKTPGAEMEIAKRNKLHKFEVIPKRWAVE